MFKNDSEEFEVRVNTINKTHEAKPTIYFLIFNISNRLGTTKATRLKACTCICVASHNDFVLEYTFHSR